MSGKLYSTSDIARELGLSRHVINCCLQAWAVCPTAIVGGQNVYGAAIVQALGKMITEAARAKKFKNKLTAVSIVTNLRLK